MDRAIVDALKSEGIGVDILEQELFKQGEDAPTEAKYTSDQDNAVIDKFVEDQLEELKTDTGFGKTFTYYALEPVLSISQFLEQNFDLPIQFDENAAALFKAQADIAAEDNPLLRTVATLGGAGTALLSGPIAGAGRVAGAGARLYGAGRGAQGAVEFGTAGALFGAAQPELPFGKEDTRAQAAGLGGVIGGVAGGALRGLPALLERASINSMQAPKIKATTPIGKAMQKVGETLDPIFGSLSTRIANESESILGRVRLFEFGTKKLTSDWYAKSEKLAKAFDNIKGEDANLLAKALYNGRFDTVEQLMKKYGSDVKKEFDDMQDMFKMIREDLIKAGYKEIGEVVNYFPRLVKDYEGLLNALGTKQKDAVTKALQDYANKRNIAVKDIEVDKRSDIIGQVLRGVPAQVKTKGFKGAQARKVFEVDDALLPYYASPAESLEFYLRSAAHNIEKAKFFGKYLDETGEVAPSVQKMLDDLVETGEMTTEQRANLVPLLQARFIQGEMAPHKFIKGLRDFGYATTIANPMSALVQLGDVATSAVVNGLRNTIRSMFNAKQIKIDDIGLRDTIIQELNEGSRALDKLFRISGFKRMDRLGKETIINAAFRRDTQRVRTEAGANAFRKKYGKLYGDETEKLIDDLRSGNVSDTVKFHLFNELSGLQPISLSEMPEAYLRSPNGRIFYALKSFTLKQYDLLRRNIVQEWKAGNKDAAIKFATRYALFVSLANGTVQSIRDILTGRITSGEELIEEFPNQLLFETIGVLGFNQYVTERYLERGDLIGFAQAQMTPAAPLFQAVTKEIADLFSANREFDVEPIAKTTPVVGSTLPLMAMWYNWLFGGFEGYLAEQDKKNQ